MKKIISLFKRHYEGDKGVYNEVVSGAEWVIAGEGVATRKFDGTACLIRDGKLYKRYECKKGKTPPPNFEPCQEADPTTGHWPGWVPIGDGPEDRYFRECWDEQLRHPDEGKTVMIDFMVLPPPDGTYELCGPKIGGNKENLDRHMLLKHGGIVYHDFPRTYEGIKEAFKDFPHEGIVWHHPDGRMVKIKRRDFKE